MLERWSFRGAAAMIRAVIRVVSVWLLLCCLWPSSSWAGDPRLEACIVAAAKYRNIDPYLLKAIAIQESGLNINAVNRGNKNGSIDHGPFQINSGWLPRLKKQGITQEQLYDPCVAPYVAAWILANEIKRHGATWRAVGAYNSPTDSNQRNYASKIQQHYRALKSKAR